MSKKKNRPSASATLSGTPRGTPSGSKDGDGKSQTNHHENNSRDSNNSKAANRATPFTSPSPLPGTGLRGFMLPPQQDVWKSFSDSRAAPGAKPKPLLTPASVGRQFRTPSFTQPDSKSSPAARRLTSPFSPNIPSTAPSTRPGFSPKTTISVPIDHKSDPASVSQQMEEVRKQATRKPSFSAPTEQVHGSADKDDKKGKSKKKGKKKVESEFIKISKPDKKTRDKSKDKTKNKAKAKNADTNKTHDKEKTTDPALIPQVESPSATEKRKQKNAARRAREAAKKEKQRDVIEAETLNKLKTEEPINQVKILLGARLKRKVDDPNSSMAFNLSLDSETRAIKRLREAIPGTKLTLVSQKLEQECGTRPTGLAVLAETAREIIVDLARERMSSNMGLGVSPEGVGGEVFRMLREQKGRLDRLELAVEKPKDAEGESEAGNDGEENQATSETSSSTSSDKERGEGGEDEEMELDQESVSDEEGTSSSGRSSDLDDETDNDADDEDDSD